MQLRAVRARDAVHGPRPTLLGEGVVVGGVPVTRGDHEVELAGRRQRVDAVGDLVTVRDGQGAAGREVVLEVDDYEGSCHRALIVALMSSSPCPASATLSIWSRTSFASGRFGAASAISPASFAASDSGNDGGNSPAIIP